MAIPVERRLRATPINVLVTDRDLNVVGDPIYCWDTVDCTARFNAVGSGLITAPAHAWVREQIEASHRVVVIRDGRVFLAGPIERVMIEQSDDGENGGVGKISITFADDLSLIAGRITYPDPTVVPESQAVDSWTFTGNAGQALINLANVNAGPGALTARQVPQLVMGAGAGLGSNVTVETRTEPLVDVLRRVALDGGGLGFRTRQADVGKQILFEVYQPQDKSAQVRFGFRLGNLRYLGYERVAPTATTAIVGGQGDGADRFLIGRTNTADETAWGRRETLISRPGNDPLTELQKAGDEGLTEAAESIRLQSSAWDTDSQRYPEHYDLGTRVTVEVAPGEPAADLVRLVHMQAWATAGELVSAMVGTQDANHDPVWVQQMRAIDRRLGRLERTTVPRA